MKRGWLLSAVTCSGRAVPLCRVALQGLKCCRGTAGVRVRAGDPEAGQRRCQDESRCWGLPACTSSLGLCSGTPPFPENADLGRVPLCLSHATRVRPGPRPLETVASQGRRSVQPVCGQGLCWQGAGWGADPQGHEGVHRAGGLRLGLPEASSAWKGVSGGLEEQRVCHRQGCCRVTYLALTRGPFVCHSICIFSAL